MCKLKIYIVELSGKIVGGGVGLYYQQSNIILWNPPVKVITLCQANQTWTSWILGHIKFVSSRSGKIPSFPPKLYFYLHFILNFKDLRRMDRPSDQDLGSMALVYTDRKIAHVCPTLADTIIWAVDKLLCYYLQRLNSRVKGRPIRCHIFLFWGIVELCTSLWTY